ncbi:MAG: L-threonylcarbamoyladenylate synthase [Bacteroidota bacterium]|nr:L-threonylcarbamoyladenylate synthase [Bacteroidota bacterium]
MIIKLYPENPREDYIKDIVNKLENNGIIIYPTDTVYAFGCAIDKPKAADRIVRLKGSKKDKLDFSLIFENISQAAEYTKPIDNYVFKAMKNHLPGPFTFLLEANNNNPKIFRKKKKTVGVRIPDNGITAAIVKELGRPLLTTSIHDDDDIIEYTSNPELLYEKYRNIVDIVVDGGIGGNEPSTIIDTTQGELEIVRQGKGIL